MNTAFKLCLAFLVCVQIAAAFDVIVEHEHDGHKENKTVHGLESTTKVKELRLEAAELYKIKDEYVILYYKHVLLLDDETLAYYNIKDKSVVFLEDKKQK